MSRTLIFWSLVVILFLGAVWAFQEILLPFVLGLGVAYLLNPLVNRLERWKIPRTVAVLLILGAFILLVLAVLLMTVPILYREILQLVSELPQLADRLWVMAQPYAERFQAALGIEGAAEIRTALKDYAGTAAKFGQQLLQGLAAGGTAVVGFLTLTLLMPIVAFFMMREWPAMTRWVRELLPRQYAPAILDLIGKIDEKVAGFVRGQLIVAFLLGLIYALALSLAGLKYGFLIGLGAGALSIIPLAGSVVGLLVGGAVAWFQSGDLAYTGLIAGIFIVGQIVEGNVLTPKVVGESVGLHPLWILFALMAGSALFGLVGMFLAVPVAASAGVLLRFALDRYRQSLFYKSGEKDSDPGE